MDIPEADFLESSQKVFFGQKVILSPSPLVDNDLVDCDNNQMHRDEQKG